MQGNQVGDLPYSFEKPYHDADHAVGDGPITNCQIGPTEPDAGHIEGMSEDRFQEVLAWIAGLVIAWLFLSAIALIVIGLVRTDGGPARPPSAWNGR